MERTLTVVFTPTASAQLIVEEITKTEAEYLITIETKAFSGHWLIFYSVPIMILVGVLDLRRRKKSGAALFVVPLPLLLLSKK